MGNYHDKLSFSKGVSRRNALFDPSPISRLVCARMGNVSRLMSFQSGALVVG